MAVRPPITQFGPDAPLTQLPADFRACLAPYNTLTPAQLEACDVVVGNDASGNGYCAQEPYRTMTYCACVNSPITCPTVASVQCTRSQLAYAPTSMLPPAGRQYLACKGQNICVNQVLVGGSQNVVQGITQQCGVIQNINNMLSVSPPLAILAFVLIIVLIAVLVAPTDAAGAESTAEPARY
jgi:hypothetical protein